MEKNNSEITFLVEDIEAVLEMNRILEKENQELKHEVARLKSHISSLKAHDFERKSILWKKIQFPINGTKDEAEQTNIHPPRKTDCAKSGASVSPKMIDKGEVAMKAPPPPPPPPLPSKSHMGSRLAVRRMPEVIEFYRCLNKRNVLVEKRVNVTGSGGENSPRNMIGEIENRSTYLSAVKSDVETQREFICFLIQKVQTAVFKEIADVDAFVKWLDGELSCLVDERAVLKHFPEWPERKTDGLREAAGLYRDLKGIESKILTHKDDPKQLLHQLERVTSNTERIREGTIKRYKELNIPSDWMLDTGLFGQIKLSSLKLAREYMRRSIAEVHSSRCTNADDIIHQGARFAFRVHQFAGGFDIDTKCMFEDLKRLHSAKFQPASSLVLACGLTD
ncbi:hypothetical protein KSS87_023493 [Heliosperma pusillum]|nr:hypothetical protein KSS87_023493 [Heliosperma pusillum]